MAIKFICMARACSIWRDESTRSWAWWRSWLWRDILAIVRRLSAPMAMNSSMTNRNPPRSFAWTEAWIPATQRTSSPGASGSGGGVLFLHRGPALMRRRTSDP